MKTQQDYFNKFLKTPKKKKKTPESNFKKKFVKLLTDLGHEVIPQNSLKQAVTVDGRKIYTNYKAGVFDLIVFSKEGLYFEFDTKSKTGKPTDSQKKRIEKLKKSGFPERLFFVSEKNYKEVLQDCGLL